MKIVCPSCAASYDVPDAVGLSKRTVRCARCGSDWVPGAAAGDVAVAAPAEAPKAEPVIATEPPLPAEEDFAPAVAEPARETAAAPAAADPEPVEALAAVAPRAVPRQNAASAIPPGAPAGQVAPRQPMGAWAVSLAALITVAAAGIAFRTPIMHAWPPSTRLYASVGLYHP